RREDALEREGVGGIVFEYEDRYAPRLRLPGQRRIDRLGGRAVDAGDGHRENRPLARRALQPDAAAQELGELLRQRQAKPGALDAALERVRDLAEFLEDDLVIGFGDADAGILDAEGDRIGAGVVSGPDADLAALGELDRVGDEVA